MRRVRKIDHAVEPQQAGAIQVMQSVESNSTPRDTDARGNRGRA